MSCDQKHDSFHLISKSGNASISYAPDAHEQQLVISDVDSHSSINLLRNHLGAVGQVEGWQMLVPPCDVPLPLETDGSWQAGASSSTLSITESILVSGHQVSGAPSDTQLVENFPNSPKSDGLVKPDSLLWPNRYTCTVCHRAFVYRENHAKHVKNCSHVTKKKRKKASGKVENHDTTAQASHLKGRMKKTPTKREIGNGTNVNSASISAFTTGAISCRQCRMVLPDSQFLERHLVAHSLVVQLTQFVRQTLEMLSVPSFAYSGPFQADITAMQSVACTVTRWFSSHISANFSQPEWLQRTVTEVERLLVIAARDRVTLVPPSGTDDTAPESTMVSSFHRSVHVPEESSSCRDDGARH